MSEASEAARKEIEERILARLAQLEEEKTDLEAALRGLRRLNGKRVIAPKDVTSDQFKHVSQKQGAKLVLKQAGKALSALDIANRMLKGGYRDGQEDAEKLARSLTSMMSAERNIFRNERRGLWTLVHAPTVKLSDDSSSEPVATHAIND